MGGAVERRLSTAERKHSGDPKSEGAFSGGARAAAPRGAADRLQVGAGAVGAGADLLIALSEALETPVSTLLGETVAEGRPDDLRAISENLERINAQLARRKIAWRRALHGLCIAAAILIAVVFAALVWLKSPYLNWHDSDPERVVFGAILHAFEYLFVRCAPIALIGSIAGACLTRRRA